jgi:hypothetical protein
MKKLPSYRHLLVLLLALLTTSYTFAQNYQCPAGVNQRATFADEFQINVNRRPYRITQNQMNTKAAFFQERIHYTENPNLDPLRLEALDIVDSLYCNAEKLRQKLNIPSNTYVTGVWIIIGMENNDVCYSFRPAVLTIDATASVDTIHTFINAPERQGHVYRYVNDKFFIDDAGWQPKRDRYFENVRIKHTNLGGHTRARYRSNDGSLDNTWRGDAREIFYSFQEILGFYAEHSTTETSGYFYGGALLVNHSASNFTSKPKGLNSWRAKHNTFITVEVNSVVNNNTAITPAIDQRNTDPGTNLAHVCPSVCNRLQYSGLQRDQTSAAEAKR